jgi:predicted secreted protein
VTRHLLIASLIALALPAGAYAQKFVGNDKCKACHQSKEMGEQITRWKASKHAKAFDNLATPEAKKVASAKGVADAQKDEKCMRCHDTAFGSDKAAPSLKHNVGVQCESCHGPGEVHVKARQAADEGAKVPDAEINKKPTEKVCVSCHNKDSPTFKSFDFGEALKAIAHPVPKK